MTEFEKVMLFAFKAHTGQCRKYSGLPFIVHPIEVCKTLSDWHIHNLDVLKAAICHDVLEDTFTTTESLEYEIGAKALSIVEELTYYSTIISKDEYMRSFGTKSVEALVIKLADRMCNIKDFYVRDKRYAEKYFRKAEHLFNTMAAREGEIVFAYGQNCYSNIERSYNMLYNVCYGAK